MPQHEPTEEQLAIFSHVRSTNRHLLIGALAGSGKTYSLLQSLRHLPQKSALFVAFNKPIASELETKLKAMNPPKGSFWQAKTFHALGLKIVQSYGRFEIKKEATEELINQAARRLVEDDMTGLVRVPFPARRAAVKLLRMIKETCVDKTLTIEAVERRGYAEDVFGKLSIEDVRITCCVVVDAYAAGMNLERRFSIDFCDMVWLPIVLDLQPPTRYQAVYVDEMQDLSLPQLALIKKMLAPGGRLIGVGDLNQSIYKWRGAVGDLVWKEMREQFKAIELPLTMTFRCSKAVVREANVIVPAFRARADAPEGSVTSCSFEQLTNKLAKDERTKTFVLSRNNTDLLHTAMHLWQRNIAFELTAGKDIIEPLFEIIDKLDKGSKARFQAGLTTWLKTETARAEKAHATAYADVVEQQALMLTMMLEYAEPKEFKRVLSDIMLGQMANLVLSTVHKVKGLEADRVYLLKQTFARHRLKRQLEAAQLAGDTWKVDKVREWIANLDPEERNLEYVAITRAKLDLVWVEMSHGVSTLTKVLDLQTREDRERGGLAGKLASRTLDGRISIMGEDGTNAIVSPGRLHEIAEAVEEELTTDPDAEGDEP